MKAFTVAAIAVLLALPVTGCQKTDNDTDTTSQVESFSVERDREAELQTIAKEDILLLRDTVNSPERLQAYRDAMRSKATEWIFDLTQARYIYEPEEDKNTATSSVVVFRELDGTYDPSDNTLFNLTYAWVDNQWMVTSVEFEIESKTGRDNVSFDKETEWFTQVFKEAKN